MSLGAHGGSGAANGLSRWGETVSEELLELAGSSEIAATREFYKLIVNPWSPLSLQRALSTSLGTHGGSGEQIRPVRGIAGETVSEELRARRPSEIAGIREFYTNCESLVTPSLQRAFSTSLGAYGGSGEASGPETAVQRCWRG